MAKTYSHAEPMRVFLDAVFDYGERSDVVVDVIRDEDGQWFCLLKSRDAHGWYTAMVGFVPIVSTETLLDYRETIFKRCSRRLLAVRKHRQSMFARKIKQGARLELVTA